MVRATKPRAEFLTLQPCSSDARRSVTVMKLRVPTIDSFRGEYYFLSNFYPATTPHRGRVFPTSEHAYHAAKTLDTNVIDAICATDDPAEAKAIARKSPLVDDWDIHRFGVMEEIVTAKFAHSQALTDRLIATRGAVLVESNSWHDQTWGSCTCPEHYDVPGDNSLGVILMSVRMRLAATNAPAPT